MRNYRNNLTSKRVFIGNTHKQIFKLFCCQRSCQVICDRSDPLKGLQHRYADIWYFGCCNCYTGMYSSILYYCNPACICLYEISEYVITSGHIGITSSGSCGHDRQSRSDDSDFSILPGRNSQSYPPECMCTDDRILCDRDGTAS